MSFKAKRILSGAAIAAAGSASLWGMTPSADASAFFNFSIVARPTGVGSYSSSLQVTAGQVLDYQVLVTESSVGTTNTQGATTRTITSITSSTISQAGDGLNGTKFDIFQLAGDSVQSNFGSTGAVQGTWTGGAGASGGTVTVRSGATNDLLSVRPVHGSGIFGPGTATEAVVAGTFTVAAAPANSTSTVKLRYTTSGGVNNSNSAKINANGSTSSGTTLALSNATETGTDPFTSYVPLTLTVAAGGGGGPKVALGTNAASVAAISTTHAIGTSNPAGASDINVSGANGSYVPGFLNALTAGNLTGYATIAPMTTGDAEKVLLNLTIGGNAPTDGQLDTLIAQLAQTGVVASRVDAAAPGTFPASLAGYDLLLSATVPAGGASTVAYDFTGASVGAVSVTDIAAIPEPGSLAAVALAAGSLLLGRRRSRVK